MGRSTNPPVHRRLADWSDDDDDPSTIRGVSGRWDKVIVLKHMFQPGDLVNDPAEILNIKEDVRDECEKFGTVTNIILYDKEDDGIITVRFDNPTSAQAAIKVFDGRMFDGRKVSSPSQLFWKHMFELVLTCHVAGRIIPRHRQRALEAQQESRGGRRCRRGSPHREVLPVARRQLSVLLSCVLGSTGLDDITSSSSFAY